MSVDTVNEALTKVRLWIQNNPESFSEDGQRTLLLMCEVMRGYLMSEDVESFNRYVDECLAKKPDAADFLLEELFDTLGIKYREELDALLAQ